MGGYFSKSGFVNIHVLLLGLDNAGKTTICYNIENNLNFDVPIKTVQTQCINHSIYTRGKYRFIFWDVAGHGGRRREWKYMFDEKKVDCIVYVIDISNNFRYVESIESLKENVFTKLKGTLSQLVIVYNKIQLASDVDNNILYLDQQVREAMESTGADMRILSYRFIPMNAKSSKSDYKRLFDAIERNYEDSLRAAEDEKKFKDKDLALL